MVPEVFLSSGWSFIEYQLSMGHMVGGIVNSCGKEVQKLTLSLLFFC